MDVNTDPHVLTSLKSSNNLLNTCSSETKKSTIYSSGISILPERISSRIAEGCFPSIEQPTDCAVPRTSFTVPDRVFAIDRGLIARATFMIDSRETSPRCFTENSTRSNPCLVGHHSESPRTVLFASSRWYQVKTTKRALRWKIGMVPVDLD